MCFTFNILYLAFFNEIAFNRDNWKTEGLDLYQNFIYFFDSLFHFPLHFVELKFPNGEVSKILYFTTFFNKICLFLIYTLTLLLITNNIRNSKLFISVILGILFISFISKTHFYSSLIDYFDIGIIKTIQLTRAKVILTFIFLFALINVKINKSYIFFILISTFLLFQINHMILPALKKYMNYNNYSNVDKKEFKYNLINFNFTKLKVLINKNLNRTRVMITNY